MLCGENGSVDITDFLDELIRGPATFSCLQQNGGKNECKFREPEMEITAFSLTVKPANVFTRPKFQGLSALSRESTHL
jgi:hypothetical protein